MSSRGSFSRSVARAAASGGGRTYGTRRPNGWYFLMALIVLGGIALIVYSRQERLHAASNRSSANAPGANANWHVALGFDICGRIQPALSANINLSTVGIRTFGDGLIDINPGAVKNASAFEGAKANLATFVKNYPGLTLTATQLRLPGATQKLWRTGDTCTAAAGPERGKGELQIKQWSSPDATGLLYTGALDKLRFANGQMLMVAFVPAHAPIPAPSSKAALLVALGSSGATTTTVGPALPKAASTSSTARSSAATSSSPSSSNAPAASGTHGK